MLYKENIIIYALTTHSTQSIRINLTIIVIIIIRLCIFVEDFYESSQLS